MNKSKLVSIQMLAIVLAQIFTVAAFATTDWPDWYKQSGTTFQEWSFGDGSVTPPPDNGVMNPYGTPTCWIGSRAVYNKDLTAWSLITDEMDIFIPNNPALQAQKEMQIEVDWKAGGQGFLPQRPLLSVFPEYADGRVVSPDISILEPATQIPGSNLFKTVFWVDIEPNPASEWVILKGDIVVDHVAIATRCIPEPATFGLLIGGAFMAIRRKGKVQR
jgi:hypothetical protein